MLDDQDTLSSLLEDVVRRDEISRVELAKQIGIGESALQTWISGTAFPNRTRAGGRNWRAVMRRLELSDAEMSILRARFDGYRDAYRRPAMKGNGTGGGGSPDDETGDENGNAPPADSESLMARIRELEALVATQEKVSAQILEELRALRESRENPR